MTTLGGNLNDTISTFRTVESSTVAENFYLFNVFGVNEVENVVIETIVNSGTIVLHIPDDTINNNEGLCIGIQRIDTIDKHHTTLSGNTTTTYHTNGSIEFVLNLVFNGNCRGSVYCGNTTIKDVYIIFIECLEMGRIYVGIIVCISVETNLNGIIAIGGNIERSDMFGHLNGVLTVFISHRRIVTISKSLNTNTSEGLTGTCIIYSTLHLFHLVLGSRNLFLGSRSSHFFLLILCYIILREGLADAEEHKEAETCTKSGLLHHIITIICLHNLCVLYYSAR